MPCLSAEQIKQADDKKIVRVEVPEWGEGAYLFVRTISAKERGEFEVDNSDALKADEKAWRVSLRARFAVAIVCDEAGSRLFTPADVEFLQAKSAAPLDRIFDAGRKLNGMYPDSVETAEKNSGSVPSVSSPSV